MEIYSYNMLAYIKTHSDIPVQFLVDENNKVFGYIDEEYAQEFNEIKQMYKADLELREYLNAFKEIKQEAMRIKYGC
ncbi:hypothetical protein [Cellulosilyticum sp. I15G10I2]|uniref:hypothetical protein n=1 Tax=Cellulosilyticum sp. I15G10I2 TaxID=1892843 RepID=UPI00085BB6B3|nr:hypothetical protein [Cellulosilyticum sp. I15G10I2]